MVSIIFNAMYSSGTIKYFGVFLWGIASIIINPCGISMLPLVVGYVANTDNPTHFRAFKVSCAFCVSIIANMIIIAASEFLGGYERFLTLIPAGVFILSGLQIMGLVHTKFFGLGSKGAAILGLASGLITLPFNAAFVKPALSLAMSNFSEGIIGGLMILLCYVLGYSAVLAAAGTLAQIFSFYLHNGEDSVLTGIVKAVNILCGLALIAGGIYLISEFFSV